ncbi:unnamed protein product [Pieris brassicae]|uniref:Allantoate amidinohydrolase n=1 Tax=Pieris brassicae TaxID=7116 RepID=A0A9P0XIZ9_PIEBR|nr:unnamed protein product [Pieris brassicae]
MYQKVPAFTELNELASSSTGGKILFATDDFFATCENIISDKNPVNLTEEFTEFGKWMDGWETRRKRSPGHDWCILKLASKCTIAGFLVDTAFFTGNFAPKYSIQAARLTPDEEALIPKRISRMGTAASESDLELMSLLSTDKWEEIVPITVLQPGYEDTRMNFQKVVSDEPWTHLRLNIYPDGGIARLRVFGEVKPDIPQRDQLVDLVSMLNGALSVDFSNAHFGHPKNTLKFGKSAIMADGWETARRLDRPCIIKRNKDGTLQIPGEEWAIFKLGFPGRAKEICIDTTQFKGNFPDTVKIEGTFLKNEYTSAADIDWEIIIEPYKLSANKEHWISCHSEVINHIRVTMAPDGGFSRLRLYGYVETDFIEKMC